MFFYTNNEEKKQLNDCVIDNYIDLKKNLNNYDIETSKDEKQVTDCVIDNCIEFKKYDKNVNNYDIETGEYIKHGIKVFQNYLLCDDEKQHVELIYDILKPKSGSTIVDMGCGVGEVGYQFKKIDPTLKIIGITNSQSQYEIAKDKIKVFLKDYHYIPLKSNTVDIVTFMESIGYGNLRQLVKEVYRVLKPGGILFIKDFFSHGYTLHNKNWDYTFNYIGEFKNLIKEFKFKILQEIELPDNSVNKRKYSNFVNSNDIMVKHHGYLSENTPTYPCIFVLEKNF